MTVATKLPPMRETDYQSRHIDLDIPALGPDVKTWYAGKNVPPLFIQPADSKLATSFAAFDAWLAEHRSQIDDAIFEYGAVMFRGFPVTSAAEFDRLMSHFPRFDEGYVGGMSPRKTVEGKVLESTRLDQNFKIILHSEMAYMKAYPARIALFSKTTAPIGGSTTLGSMDEFMARMPADLRAKLEKHQTVVVRSFAPKGASQGKDSVDHPGNIGWDSAFFTDDKAEVERLCEERGMEYRWNDDGSLTLKEIKSTFTKHPRDGTPYYRTNLHTNNSFQRAGFGDVEAAVLARQKEPIGHFLDNGEMLTEEETQTILGLYDQIELAWQWQDGDVAIADNLKVAHGRNPFEGPREVLVCLLK